MGVGAGVNPLKTTLGGSPLLWKPPKVHWEGPGGTRSTAGFQVLGDPTQVPPLSAQGVQVHLDPLASAEHPHGGEEPPGGDPNLPAPHDHPVPCEEHLGGGTNREGHPETGGAGGDPTHPPKKPGVKGGIRQGKMSQKGGAGGFLG